MLALSMASCNDFLNDNRYPMSMQTVDPEFWDNATNVENQLNYFYQDYSGYGNGTGTGRFYFSTLSDDQGSAIGGSFQNWTNTNVPASSTYWSSPYVEIRRANLVIDGVTASSLGQAEKNNYLGIARLNRAYQYWQLVRCYGDVPLVEKALDPADEAELYGPRTDRNVVMDFVLADLNFAAENIAAQNGKNVFSKDMANAMKAEICLFEGSYAKYHQNDEARAKTYFNEVVNASNAVMGSYSLAEDYASLYNSARTATANGMVGLDSNPEIIFFKPYEQGVFMHSTCDYTGSSTPLAGISRDAFESFLFLDGNPMSLQADKKQEAVAIDNGDQVDSDGNVVVDSDGNVVKNYILDISGVLAARDKRLSALIDDVLFFDGTPYERYSDIIGAANTMLMTSSTGYGIKKYWTPYMTYADLTTAAKNYTCAPLFWLARVYLAYAEARAELGTLTDADLNNTINKLYARAGLPTRTVSELSALNDPANNMGVSSLLWEIRRCRRCELMTDDGIRYWDLIRWKQLELLDSEKHPNVFLGAYVGNLPSSVLSSIEVVNGYIKSAPQERVFEEKQYFYPIPSGQIALNNNLTQNPGWQ